MTRKEQAEQKDNTWKIVTGVLAGILGWHATGTLVDLYHHNKAVERYNKAVEQIANIAPPPATPRIDFNAQTRQRQEEAARQEREAKKLAPDEQCYGGQRFRRLENGWEQLPNRPC